MRALVLFSTALLLIISCAGCSPVSSSSESYSPGFFYVSLNPEPVLFFSNNPGGQVIRQIALNPPADCSLYSLRPAPAGPWIAVEWECTFGPSVELFNTHTGESHFALSDPTIDSRLLNWQPDGSAYYLQIGTLSVPQTLKVDVVTGKAIDLGLSPFIYDLAAAPDGKRIIYSLTHGIGFGSETWAAGPQGQNPSQLLIDERNITALAKYSPDGKQIAFIKIPDNQEKNPMGELWLMDSEGFSPHKLADADAGEGYSPAWSPDGEKIAFVQHHSNQTNGALDLAVIDLERMKIVTLPAPAGSEAAWSPDGLMISYSSAVSKNAGGDTIYVSIYKLSSTENIIIGKQACCSGWIR